MPWTKPTLQQLNERISQDFSGRLLDGSRPLDRSVISVLAKVWAGASHEMHGMLAWLFLQVFPDTAEIVYLERWADVWGLFRKTAAPASGDVVFTGLDGSVIAAGTLVQNQSTQILYAAQSDRVLVDGSGILRVTAVTPGLATNMPAGGSVSLVAPVAGVRSVGSVGESALTGGADEESDASLRARLLERLRNPPRGGSKKDWETWAKEVPGVTRAWCYPLGDGIGTVSLTFVCDGLPDLVPSQEMVDRVRAHIEPLRPATVKEYTIFAPVLYPLDVTLAISPDTQAVREAVLTELDDLLAREGEPGGIIYRSHITEAISLAPGEFDSVVTVPAGNVHVPEGYFPVLGAVTWGEYGDV
jgi:uncharacterized phage protein gp47/JayE